MRCPRCKSDDVVWVEGYEIGEPGERIWKGWRLCRECELPFDETEAIENAK